MGCCEHGNEQLGLQNGGNFLTIWRNISLLRRTLLHAVSQLPTAQHAVYPHTTNCITLLCTATIQSVARTAHSVHCTLSVSTVKGCCTVHFVLCSVSSIKSSNTVAVNSVAVEVNWRNLRFLWRTPSGTVWRHSCVTLCCWRLPLYNGYLIFIRHYTYLQYRQCNCGCNQRHTECNLLKQ